MSCGNSTSLTNEVMGNTVSNVSLTGTSSAALTAFGVDAGRNELSGNAVSGVSNTGTSGVNSLVSRATTVLGSFVVSSGQLVVVENGLTVVLGNLTNAGILNHTGGDMLITGNFVNSGTFAQTLGDITAPLPVGLTAFQAAREGPNAVLSWITVTEQDNRGFGIEVSTDGRTFREIGFVAAEAGNSSTARHYRFVDASAGKAGVRYYCLCQDDRISGEPHYYGPHKLDFEAPAASFAAYPTQFGPALTVALAHPGAATATLRLLDGLGREVWRQEVAPGAAPLHVQPVAPAGAYVLTATVAGQVLRQRVVKE